MGAQVGAANGCRLRRRRKTINEGRSRAVKLHIVRPAGSTGSPAGLHRYDRTVAAGIPGGDFPTRRAVSFQTSVVDSGFYRAIFVDYTPRPRPSTQPRDQAEIHAAAKWSPRTLRGDSMSTPRASASSATASAAT